MPGCSARCISADAPRSLACPDGPWGRTPSGGEPRPGENPVRGEPRPRLIFQRLDQLLVRLSSGSGHVRQKPSPSHRGPCSLTPTVLRRVGRSTARWMASRFSLRCPPHRAALVPRGPRVPLVPGREDGLCVYPRQHRRWERALYRARSALDSSVRRDPVVQDDIGGRVGGRRAQVRVQGDKRTMARLQLLVRLSSGSGYVRQQSGSMRS
jgi:hypothetical protein